ncbi:hypothetical protein AAG570_006466 [Ranatra chinensis]|uniref:Uncharacterized protein n=1 Tax=Ranatra chinensis TaxID=642074 RepID=A0ABD0Z4P0_9HEMI
MRGSPDNQILIESNPTHPLSSPLTKRWLYCPWSVSARTPDSTVEDGDVLRALSTGPTNSEQETTDHSNIRRKKFEKGPENKVHDKEPREDSDNKPTKNKEHKRDKKKEEKEADFINRHLYVKPDASALITMPDFTSKGMESYWPDPINSSERTQFS